MEQFPHDDVIKWKHFPRYWPFVWGIHRSPVNSPHEGQWHGALMFSLICTWINGWVNNSEAGDLRRRRAHYDLILVNDRVLDTCFWQKASFRTMRTHQNYEPPEEQVNKLRPRQNGRYFADDTFKCIFFNENAWISLQSSLKFVPKVRINNIPALVQIMVWRRPGDKPLSEPMVVRLPTHICVTRLQWVKTSSAMEQFPNAIEHWGLSQPLKCLFFFLFTEATPK